MNLHMNYLGYLFLIYLQYVWLHCFFIYVLFFCQTSLQKMSSVEQAFSEHNYNNAPL